MKRDSLEFERVDDVIDALENLDLLCEERGIKAEILILGGAAMLILMEQINHKFRPTRDIDVNIISTNNKTEIIEVLREANIQIVGGVMELPAYGRLYR